MNNLRFGLDLDGVLANFGAQVISAANRLWPNKMPEDYVPDNWDYADVLNKEDWKAVWAEIKATPDFWLDEKEQGNGVEELRDFLDYNTAEVYFITSRAETVGDSVLVQSSQWLSNRRRLWPRNGYSTVIPVADPKKKRDVIEALKLPFMLDDYAVTVEGLQTLKTTKTYLLDQPWNRYAAHLPRVFSVKEYLEIVVKNS
jgi:hypothetical protein